MTITITAEGVGAICGVLAMLAAIGIYVVRAEIDRQMLQLREWINGSFMRAAEVEARLKVIEARHGFAELE